MTLDEAKAILEALVREEVELVVIGSMAMAAQGLPRATHHLDLFVSPELGNLEATSKRCEPSSTGKGGRNARSPNGLRTSVDEPDLPDTDDVEIRDANRLAHEHDRVLL